MRSVCLPVSIPPELNGIDDELKAIYHSSDSVCIWVFDSPDDRNRFVDQSVGMSKAMRDDFYREFVSPE